MPFITDKVSIQCPFLDKRVKLLPCQKEMIHYWYGQGTSIRGLARMFNVNKRLIQFELFPERKERDLQHRRDRGGSAIYYKKEKNTEYMRIHRRHKYETLKESI